MLFVLLDVIPLEAALAPPQGGPRMNQISKRPKDQKKNRHIQSARFGTMRLHRSLLLALFRTPPTSALEMCTCLINEKADHVRYSSAGVNFVC